jgi:hypothetical protein
MEEKKMIPYSLYLPSDLFQKVKDLARERKAAPLIRDAIGMVLNGQDLFNAGYNKAIADAAKVIYENKEAQMIAVNGRDLGAILTEQIKLLEKPSE